MKQFISIGILLMVSMAFTGCMYTQEVPYEYEPEGKTIEEPTGEPVDEIQQITYVESEDEAFKVLEEELAETTDLTEEEMEELLIQEAE